MMGTTMKLSIRSLPLVGLLLAVGFAAFARQEAETRRDDGPAVADRPASADAPRPIYVRWSSPVKAVIQSILPPGTRVAKDQLVCECRDDVHRDELADQMTAVDQAKWDFEDAKTRFKIAELSLETYLEGTYPRDLTEAEGKIIKAKLAHEAARERFEQLKDAGEAQAHNARFKVDLAEYRIEAAETELEVLKEYGYKKNRFRLEGDIERARAEMLARQSDYELIRERAERFRRVIEETKVYAPAAGVLEYRERRIGPDAVVRRGTLLFVIHPDEQAGPVAANPTHHRFHLDLNVVGFLRDELGTRRIVEESLTDEEIKAIAADATDRLGRTVTPSAVRIAIGYSKLREEWRKKRQGGPDAPEADRGGGDPR